MDIEERTIASIEFGLLSSDAIRDLSAVTVTQVDYWDYDNNKPKDGGLLDLRMGVSIIWIRLEWIYSNG